FSHLRAAQGMMARCAPMLRKLGLLLCQLRAAQDRMARRASQREEKHWSFG
ncbi:hypothetical protein A2U01_0069794, partial [Trifolium medium]|nr:hypothetical protein [Trifolium medium]